MTITKKTVGVLVVAFALIAGMFAMTINANAASTPGKPSGVKITKVGYADTNSGKNWYVLPSVSWGRVSGAKSYQVNVSGTNMSSKTFTVSTNSMGGNGHGVKISNPKKGGTVKVKVRAYNGKYGSWSTVATKSFKRCR